MKRAILYLSLTMTFTAFCWADSNHGTLMPAKHHVQHHHAHKAGKHHTPKRHRHSI